MFLASILVLMWSAAGASPETDATTQFLSAKPVWPEGRETEKNLFVGFRAVVTLPEQDDPHGLVLRTTGSTLYRVTVNGAFCGHGPARGPHGYYRIDEWRPGELFRPGPNVLALEVAGYNANSYYLLDQPSFLRAELVLGNRILASTGGEGAAFEATILDQRVQKVQRYSFQRPFIELYHLTPEWDQWRSDPGSPFTPVTCTVTQDKQPLPRRVPYTNCSIEPAVTLVSSGTMRRKGKAGKIWRDRSLTRIGPKLGGYPEKELEEVISTELQHIENQTNESLESTLLPEQSLELSPMGFHILDLGMNRSGFPRLTIECATPVKVQVLFDEFLQNGDVNWRRLGCVNALTYELTPGKYELESFEPYTARYLKVLATEGACTVSKIGMRTYENPDTGRAAFSAPDERLNHLFEAGRATFAQNAVDIFMDCPHRERAGWLCDSFFTARSAMALSGNTLVEKNFIENYLLPEHFAHLPKGMLPMCYPADHNDGVFIPNWALWFVVQLGEYLERSGDRALVDALQPRVLELFDYFKPFENEDGLLEKLESWVFIEWSEANHFVQDVNYPSNMLYAGALATTSRLYGIPALGEKAAQIRETVRQQAGRGMFFVDNAKRVEGRLEVQENRSEVCQYYAFYFSVATPESHPELWRILRDEFGPARKHTKAHGEVHPANSFIGNMLRAELLSRQGHCQQLLEESIDYLHYMAERTGTLWENVHDNASLNHGFASHIVHTLYRDVLGLYRVDPVHKQLTLRFSDAALPQCKGAMPVGDDLVKLAWEKKDGTLTYTLDAPEDYEVTIENRSGLDLVCK